MREEREKKESVQEAAWKAIMVLQLRGELSGRLVRGGVSEFSILRARMPPDGLFAVSRDP